ncbi:MAG: hypothetical protein G01um101420_541 [Parcubacteria group bacterium Gr01-1014_20]|nr:MAG: hypothetical protein G01um101420_541 [Parcubacteria group bacterium Gr01-1014_20]
MTSEKILEAAGDCKRLLVARNIPSARFPADSFPDLESETLAHTHYMLDEIINVFIPADRREKAFRWLGFVQGVLWSKKLLVIADLKNQNRPASN